MKRINPKTNKPFKYEDIRDDGYIFVDYRKTRPLTKDGYFQENWLSPSKFEQRREYSKSKKISWRKERPEYVKEYAKRHAKEKPYQYAAKTAKRRAALLQRTPNWLTPDDLWIIEEAYALAALRTQLLGFPWHVDHIIPLQGRNVSGLHVPTNIQVIPGSDNVKKHNRFDWGQNAPSLA